MKPWAERFYKSKAWQRVREQAMQRDARLCVDCLKKNRITPAEEVHHIVELTQDNINNPAIALNLDNLVCLCRECHQARHGEQTEKRYTVDELGRVSISPY